MSITTRRAMRLDKHDKSKVLNQLRWVLGMYEKKEKMLDKEIRKAEEDKPYHRGARDATKWCKDYLSVAIDLIAGMGSKEESLEELDNFTKKEMESEWDEMESLKDNPPEPGKRVIFGCEDGFVGEGFMARVDQELRPVRFYGDRAFFGGIVMMPRWWAELPKVPKEESNEE